jgi:hypothetical protein
MSLQVNDSVEFIEPMEAEAGITYSLVELSLTMAEWMGVKAASQKRLCPRGLARAEVTPGACFNWILSHYSFLSKLGAEQQGSEVAK